MRIIYSKQVVVARISRITKKFMSLFVYIYAIIRSSNMEIRKRIVCYSLAFVRPENALKPQKKEVKQIIMHPASPTPCFFHELF